MLPKYITKFVIFLFLVIASRSFAQPAFTKEDFMQIGNQDTLAFDYLLDGTVPTATGPNYTWDFSAVKGIAGLHTYSYRAPQHSGSEPFVALGASLEEWHSSPDDEYALWKISNDTLYKMREGAASGTTFIPPYAQFVFPMSFGQTFSSTTNFGAAQRQNTVIYDGFGTLKTKKGTFANVFRLAIRDYDSIFVTHTANDYRAFWWLKAGGSVPLFQLNQYASAGTIYNAFVSFAHSVNSDVKETADNKLPSFFPNPTHDNLSISGRLPERIILQNSVGITVRTFEMNDNSSLNLNGLSSGIYFLSYMFDSNLHRLIIAKE